MKSKGIKHEDTLDLFRSELKSILNLRHELCLLSEEINWDGLDAEFGKLFPSDKGCPAKATRLIAGLFYLKALYKISDEDLPRRWIENPYWQYFCGEQYLRHDFPLDSSTLSKWRKRLREKELERLLQETIAVGLQTKVIKKRDIAKVTIDTTVQEKAIAYPTDARLYHKAREQLVQLGKRYRLLLRQNYNRLSEKALLRSSNYARAQQMKRSKRETKRLKTYLGRVYRDVKRKLELEPQLKQYFSNHLKQTEKLLQQTKHSKDKLYSLHAPEVECIGKGKVNKRYEFGVKVGLVVPHKKNFIVGAQSLPGNPYDGHTLKSSLDQIERLTGKRPTDAYVDLGYRGHNELFSTVHLAHRNRKKLSRTVRSALKRRNAIEPIVGHTKNDGHLSRNYLKGKNGDNFNAIMSAIGFNLRQILKTIRIFWLYFLSRVFGKNIALDINFLDSR